jgi:tRNA(Ile2) C34 agmatinyltransferase TiaS
MGLHWNEEVALAGNQPDWEIRELAEEYAANDICPKCYGELDTGWECTKCGYDAKPLIRKNGSQSTI